MVRLTLATEGFHDGGVRRFGSGRGRRRRSGRRILRRRCQLLLLDSDDRGGGRRRSRVVRTGRCVGRCPRTFRCGFNGGRGRNDGGRRRGGGRVRRRGSLRLLLLLLLLLLALVVKLSCSLVLLLSGVEGRVLVEVLMKSHRVCSSKLFRPQSIEGSESLWTLSNSSVSEVSTECENVN